MSQLCGGQGSGGPAEPGGGWEWGGHGGKGGPGCAASQATVMAVDVTSGALGSHCKVTANSVKIGSVLWGAHRNAMCGRQSGLEATY